MHFLNQKWLHIHICILLQNIQKTFASMQNFNHINVHVLTSTLPQHFWVHVSYVCIHIDIYMPTNHSDSCRLQITLLTVSELLTLCIASFLLIDAINIIFIISTYAICSFCNPFLSHVLFYQQYIMIYVQIFSSRFPIPCSEDN